MRAPSTAALLVLASLCHDTTVCFAEAQQDPFKEAKLKEMYRAACPAYEHYARFSQYVEHFILLFTVCADHHTANRTAKAR